MKYKIVCYKESPIFIDSKKDLFNFMDLYNLCYFTKDFNENSKGVFEIKERLVTILYEDGDISKYYEKTYINGIFIIYNEFNVKIETEVLFAEYNQSRGLCKKKKTYNSVRMLTKKAKKRCRFKMYNRENSFTKEYRDNITALEYGVKIRIRRSLEVKDYHIYMSEYHNDFRRCERNWKSQSKRNRQFKSDK